MIKSMTGFGLSQVEDDSVHIEAQVKSVNSRFIEVRFKIPKEYNPIESDLKKMVGQKISRGTVDVLLYRTDKRRTQNEAIQFDEDFARSYLKAALDLGRKLGLEPQLSLQALLRVPNLQVSLEPVTVGEAESKLAKKALDQALSSCLGQREREGEALRDNMGAVLDQIEKFLSRVEKKKDSLDHELQEKLESRLKELSQAVQLDPNRLAGEVLFLRERADISEELSRGHAHVSAFKQAFKETGPVGKKLEFYTQELHREINTMGSKTQSLGVILEIIEAKTMVERLREQVQNVE